MRRNSKGRNSATRVALAAMMMVVGLAHCCGQTNYLNSFDDKLFHFGIQVGLTQSKFDLKYNYADSVRSVMQGVTSRFRAGFHIAIIGDLRLGRYFNLRFLPGVTLISRSLDYHWEEDYLISHKLLEGKRDVESVYGELPLEIKMRAWRWHNFRPYVTAGCSYGFDFASLRKNKNNTDESIIRIGASDFRYTVGVGTDIFLRYVKFAIELKMAFGVPNLLVKDDEYYTTSIEKMSTRTVMLSFTFEG